MKKIIVLVLLLMSVLLVGCADVPWDLVAEGVLTNYSEVAGQAVLTFDDNVAVLLGAYSLEEPKILVLGKYYYLYKENGGVVWNGYHLLSSRR